MAAERGHASGGSAAIVILLALVALVVWGISLYVHPFTGCGACDGTGLNRGSTGKRFGLCKRCGGSRRRQRFGSRSLHRWIRSARSEWRRSRALKREERVAERTRNPRQEKGSK